MAKTGATTNKVKEQNEAASSGVAFSFDPSIPFENEGHERFCLEVLNRKSNVRAYMLAYPDAAYMSAACSSTRLIKDDKIQSRINYLKDEQRNRLKMSSDDVIMALEMAYRFDPADLFNPDGSLIPVNQLPAEVRLCIERIEFEDIVVGEGENKRSIGRTGKVHVISKKSALEMLGRYHKLFTDKVEHSLSKSLEDILTEAHEAKTGTKEADND